MLYTISAHFPSGQYHVCLHLNVCELHVYVMFLAHQSDSNTLIIKIISFNY